MSLGFVAAHADWDDDYVFKEKISETEYYPNKNKVVTTTTYIDYENDKRYPTDDYRHGYTYRATKEYRDSYKEKYVKRDYDKYDRYDRYDRDYDKYYRYDKYDRYDRYDTWNDGKVYYLQDVKYGSSPVLKSCYTRTPRNKLFYIKC